MDYMTSRRGGGVINDLHRAMQICKSSVPPDLTGDLMLQVEAAQEGIAFRIRPRLDARLKFKPRWEYVTTGTHILPPYTDTIVIPKVTVEEHDPGQEPTK
ncbi:hypothetical protein [Rhizosaccharibacter radicis]|uniref:Uncharacterized protein n=1 Tax=Rhizosaccharibacter radicis TaxID=2782605 RepID=A0ABT1VWU1_9PROT|nr:hypothetical protein [Acetobacteraceae bacterium KSS12]